MNESFNRVEALNVQIGYERGRREMAQKLYEFLEEVVGRGESAVTIDALANVIARELRR